MPTIAALHEAIIELHGLIRSEVVAACQRQSVEQLSAVDRDDEGDTIYAIDKVSEKLLIRYLTAHAADDAPLVLIAEGLDGGHCILPQGATEKEAVWRVIVDPIDGTRGIMYQKRSAWILTGVAPNRGIQTSLRDIELAVMTEIPLVKQHLSDQLWAVRGKGFEARRFNRITNAQGPLPLQPSRARSIQHGCATVARYFPGARDVAAAIDDEIVLAVLGPTQPGKAHCFEDQYVSTGGQLYELIAGHDRFTADLRAQMGPIFAARGLPQPLCCHPYDLCAALIAAEAGILITDAAGLPLDAPLDVAADVSWIGYANHSIRGRVEPALQQALRRRGLLEKQA